MISISKTFIPYIDNGKIISFSHNGDIYYIQKDDDLYILKHKTLKISDISKLNKEQIESKIEELSKELYTIRILQNS